MSQEFRWTLIGVGLVGTSLLLFGPYAALPTAVFIALIVGMVVGVMKLYWWMSGTAATPGGSAVTFGLVANAIPVGLTMISILPTHPGSYGRPMMLAAFYFLFAAVMTPLGIGKAVQAWSREKSLAIAAIILSLGILPVEGLTLYAVAGAKAFELAP